MGNKKKYVYIKKKNRAVPKKRVKKPYSPPLMVRYEGGYNGRSTMWGCTQCLSVCHSEITAAQHSINCRKIMQEMRQKPPTKPPIPE